MVAALEAADAQAAVASEVADKRPERICHLPARPEILCYWSFVCGSSTG